MIEAYNNKKHSSSLSKIPNHIVNKGVSPITSVFALNNGIPNNRL